MSLEYLKQNFQNQNPTTTSAPSTPAFVATPKTPYQQNVSQPVPQSVPDTRQALGQIFRATQQDQTYGRQLQDQFVALQSDPGSIYYAPYAKQTNQAVSRLNELGIENVDRDWYDQTTFMDRYLNFNGQTNTPSAPTKKSSEMERIAYQRYQYGKSLQQTDDAIRECDALNEEINFLANWGDRNYSDDEIFNYLYANGGADFQKKYPTLAKMDSSLEPGQALMEFNEAIPYSKDWVYGRIWAARNNGGTGNMYRDMAMSALGEGNQWQENADIAGRLEWGSDSYAPYTVSSTTDDVCMYLGVPSYDRQYLMDHQPDMNDKTSVDMWNKGMEAVQFTETAQEEAAKLNERLNTKLQTAESVEEVMKWLDNRLASGEYDSLAKLDKSTDKINSLIDTSAPIDFSRNGIRKMAEEAVAKNLQKKNGGQTIEDNGIGSVSEQEAEAIKAGDKNVKEASDLINATDSEQNTFTNRPSSWFDRVYDAIGVANPVTLLKNNEGAATTKFANDTIVAVQDIMTNMKSQQQLDALNKENLDLIDRCDQIRDGFGAGTGMFSFMYDIEDGPTVKRGDADVANSRYAPALVELYETVTGESAIDEDGGIKNGVMEKAQMFYDYIVNGSRTYEDDEEVAWLLPEFSDTKQNLEAEIARTAGASQKNKLENFMWNARIAAYDAAGIDTTGLKTGRAVANSLYYFMDYDPTVWVENDRYNSMMIDKDGNTVATFDIVKGEAAEKSANAKEALDNALFIRDYINENGLEVPDNVRINLDRYIAKLERDQKDYDYFTIQGNDDFAEYAEKGRQMDSELPRPQQLDYEDSEGFSYGSMMNQTEKDTYFYLLAKDGKDAATRYWSHLNDPEYGVIATRGMKKVKEQARELADKNPVLANALAVLSSPAEAFLGAAYMGLYSLAGMELNPDSPLLSVGKFSQFVNEETSANIMKSVPEGPLRDLAMGAYEIVYNQTRSMTNSFYTGGLNIGGRFGSILTEEAGAVPMATGAAALAIADAKSKGATDGEAFIIGAVTFGMEDFSEGLTRSNIQSAFNRGGAEEVAVFAKQKVKEWLTKSGFEEAFGETLTDVVENEVEKKVLGGRSDHAENVRQYLANNGLDPNNPVDVEKAENAVLAEEVAGYAHTAIISYLSPSISVATSVAKEGISDFHNIRVATRNMQKSGMDVSMTDVRKQYYEWKQAALEEQQRAANAPKQEQTEQATEQTAEQAQTEAQNAEPAENQSVLDRTANVANEAAEQTAGVATPSKTPSTADQAFLADLAKLETVQNSDTSTQAAAIGALFGGEENTASGDTAKAAAANITNLFGSMQSAVEQIKNIVTCAHIQHISHEAVKSALQTAVLSASSMANEVANSEEFKNASPMEQATMLAETVEVDQANEAVQAETAKSVHENRISAAEGELIRNGALDSIKNLKANMEKAEQNVRMAEESLSEKQGEVQAKSEALTAATEAFAQDPSADNQHMVDRAANELDKASAVEQEYEQHLDNVNRANADAKSRYEAEQEAAMRNVRQQAEAMVAQQDQQRAEQAAQVAEQQRVAQEQAAQAQAEEDQRSGKAAEDQTRSLAEDWANLQHLEGEERENFIDRVMNIQEQRKLGKIDMTGKLNNAEGYLAIQAFARKTGLNFQLSDTLPDGSRGMYQNGTVYLNSNLVKSGKMTIGQALVEASLHEIPHAMEQTKNYQTYRNVVLGSMFGVKGNQTAQQLYKSNAQFRAAVDQKIADYSGLQNLTVEGAEKEIVADFARLHLADKEVVQRFMDAGMGGKMRNTLHNINQALKNFFGGLKGEDRTQAEYLRRAERAFQKAMNELAKTAVHPEGGQFSVAQIAQATGMTFDEETLKLYDANGNEVDGVTNKITPEMVDQTPVGMLINNGLTGEAQQKAREMMAGLMNMVARYKDSNLVWEIGATTLSSTFSALKSNSDPQYKTTVDFGTVCAKTQAIIDVMSKVMLDRVKEGKSGGLSREDIMKVYNEVNKAGLSVPCPVCYVFSRWMGVPSLLGQMSQYQNDYVVTKKDSDGKTIYDKDGNAVIDAAATQKIVDDYIKSAEAKYGDAKAINSAKTKFQNKLAKLEEKRMDLEGSLYDKTLSAEQKDKIRGQIKDVLHQMTEIDKQLGEVNAYNWITQALCKKEGDRFVVDSKFKLTPDEILFDLNRTGEFAGYEKNWRYRNTRGAGMGKAIMPYSGETIGDILYGVKKNGRQIKNPWLNMDAKAAGRQLRDARARAIKQNLVGGQRLQSTSDFRPEWGLDYIMSFLELQAAGSKVQMYTKVAEAVDFFASVGADVNLSIMGQGQGWHVDENGNKVLDFSSITGMDYETAKALKDKYNNVQMILVGMNDTHIRLAMANSDIDFIIPWHSSGNSKDVLAGLIKSVGEKLDSSVDYTTTQTDMVKGTVKTYRDENNKTVEYTVPGKQTESEKALWDARMKLLTKGGNALTQAERETLLSNPITSELYRRFTEKGYDDECYGVKLSKDQANQIFPYEYWDTSLTKDKADENGKRFVEYCEAMGIVPRFSQFKDDPGYWKLLIDRPMYNNDGTYHQQQIIDVTNANIGELNEEGKLTGSDLPQQAQAKYAPKDPRNANYAKYTKAEQDAVENAKAALEEQYDDGTEGQYSVYGDMTDADIEQALAANDIPDNRTVIYIKNGQNKSTGETVDFIDLILNGEKTGETRTHNRLPVNQWLGISKGGKNSVVYGRVKFGEPYQITKDSPEYKTSFIEGVESSDGKHTDYDVPEDGFKWYYPIEAIEDFRDNPQPVLVNGSYGKYSTAGDMTDADIEQRLADAGVIPRAEPETSLRNTTPIESTFRELEGENPTLTAAGNGPQRAFGGQNGMLSESDEIARQAKAYVMNQNRYTEDSNPEQIDRAINWIRSNKSVPGSDGFAESMEIITGKSFDYRSADGQARMIAMMGMAVAKNDILAQVQLADAFNRQGTDLGRALQARKMFRLMTPLGRVSTLQKMLRNTADETGRTDLKFSDWIYRAAAAASEEGDFELVYNAAAQELGEQIPANWKDKLVGWRMLSMLGNPRTHIRNVMGNAMFIPMVGLKNKAGAFLEIATRVKPGERTKTLGFANKESRDLAKRIVGKIESELRGEAKYNDRDVVKAAQKTWGTGNGIVSRTLGKMLQGLSDFNSNMLEWEDWIFLKGHFKRAFAGYMTANKLSTDQMTGDTLKKATEYAIREAHKATYRDANSVATALNNFSKRAKGTNLEGGAAAIQFAVNAVLPFKKTPANILKRGIEYSPLGLIDVAANIKNMIQTVRHENDNSLPAPKKTVTPAQLIDKFASTLTGTGVMILGAVLGALGAANAGFDDDDPEDRLKKLNGEQEYGVNFGKALNEVTSSLFGVELFGEDVTRTMDWAAPVSMPFFVGVAVEKQLSKEHKDLAPGEIINAMLGITEPVFNLSMLDGVNSLFNVSQNDPMNPATQIAMKVLLNYGSSFVPTLFGQIARTADPVRRQNFVQSGSKPYQVFSTIKSVQNKLPGASELNIPYRNAYGEVEMNGNWLETFFAPWYKKEIKGDAITKEINEVFENSKEVHEDIIPELPPKSFTVGQEPVRPTDKEYEQMQIVTGETGVNLLNELIASDEYKMADYDTKAMMMEDVWAYAKKKGKQTVAPEVKLDTWMAKGEKSGDMVNTIIDKTINTKMTDYTEKRVADLTTVMEQGDEESVKTIVTELRDEMKVDLDIIRKPISDYFRPMYYEAYAAEDDNAMDQIKELLFDLDIGYTTNTFSSWNTNAKKQKAPEIEEEEEEDRNFWLDMENNSGSRFNPGSLMASGAMSDVRPSTSMPSRPASESDWDQYMNDLDEYWANYDFDRYDPVEQNYGGTIDINNRKVVHNADGSISTDLSFSFLDENPDSPNYGKEVLIPAIVNGKEVSQRDAIQHYYDTNEYFGVFDNWQDADEYSIMLHNRGDWYYNR